MRYITFIGMMMMLYSCGTSNNFTKRKYTKGIYIEKHSTAKTKKTKSNMEKYSKTKVVQEELVVHRDIVIDFEPKSENENRVEANHIENYSLPKGVYVIEEQNELENETSSPIVDDGEELEKDDKSRKPIIFGILAMSTGVLTFILVLIDFFILENGLLALFSIPVLAATVIMTLLGIIFSAIELRKGNNPIAKTGMILSVLTLLFITATILLFVLVGF